MKIGLFGGTFDPIHFGHINLAVQLFEAHGLNELLFCPAWRSPFKEASTASGEARKAMVQLAIEEIPHFKLLCFELDRPGVSYTIDTLRFLSAKHPGAELYLLLSQESFQEFPRWKEHAEILRLVKPLVGPRGAAFEISSTQVRERLKKGLYCGHLIPAKSLDYIHQHHLYS